MDSRIVISLVGTIVLRDTLTIYAMPPDVFVLLGEGAASIFSEGVDAC